MKRPFNENEVDDYTIIKWERMGKNMEGSALDSSMLDIMSVSVDGKDGSFHGGHVVIEGAISDTFYPLTASNGSLMSISYPEIIPFFGRYPKVKVRVVNGTDKTSITVSMFCRKIDKRRTGR